MENSKKSKYDFLNYCKDKYKPKEFNDRNLEDTNKKETIKYINSISKQSKNRYENFKNSGIEFNKIKKYVFAKYDIIITDVSATILSILSKIYCGELIENSRKIMKKKKIKGKITPDILEQSYLEMFTNEDLLGQQKNLDKIFF